MADLKARKFSPVYYLMGEEGYYIDRIADYIAENALQPEERDFNQTILFGSDVTASAIADAARRYPMMAERQVVIVKEAQNIKQTDALEKYMKQPLKTTILVICHKNGKIDGRKREYVKTIQAAGVLFESPKLRDRDLPPFIENYLKERQVSIDAKSTQLIADAIGADLSRLASELDKLIIALNSNPNSQRSAVTPQLVEDQIGISKDFNGFELRDAIVNRNVFKANQIINYFDKNPKAGSIYAFLPLLFNYFQNLMLAHYCPQKQSQEAVAGWLELRSPWAAKDYMTGMRNFTATKTMLIISKLREIDAKSKGLDNPNTPPGELMKELIFYILH
ncbi:MAG: DNA polymerase III subunit delta [Prevotella sp.]|nr:DNA polymerase III subunit delta [Prevotella sp.]